MAKPEQLKTLAKGLRVLSLLNTCEVMTISEISKMLGMARTNTNRILATLMAEGYVERIPFESRYRLTPQVHQLSGGFSDESWMTHIASPLLFERTREIGWPLALATPAGDAMVVRITTDYASPFALEHFRVGHRVPMMHGPTGQAYLAFLPDAEREALLEKIRSSTDQKQAIAHDHDYTDYLFSTIRARGYAHLLSPEYNEAGIAVPIYIDNVIRASLFVSYIKRAFPSAAATARFVPTLQEISAKISSEVAAARHPRRSKSPSAFDGGVTAPALQPQADLR